MIQRMLITFNRKNGADFSEKLGNIGLGLLRIGCGRTVTVTNKSLFTEKPYSTTARIAAIALFIFALPFTSILALIGCLSTAVSKSHAKMFQLYTQSSDPVQTTHSPQASQKKRVTFALDGVRARLFYKHEAPAAVDKVDSINLSRQSSLLAQDRKYPPIGLCDTIQMTPSGQIKSGHPKGHLFSDDNIVQNLPIIKKTELAPDIYAYYTQNDKAIIQQQATRGCTAATAAMLIMDHHKNIDLNQLQTRNLGNDNDQLRDIKNAGLNPCTSYAKNLSALRELICSYNSCIVSLSGALGGHVVVVDEVSQDLSTVRLRDPYHGWEITVTQEAFLQEWRGGDVIFIVK